MKIELSTDKEHVEKVRAAVKANDGYCPCQLIKDERSKCMCLNFLESDDEWCHCGIYRKVEE